MNLYHLTRRLAIIRQTPDCNFPYTKEEMCDIKNIRASEGYGFALRKFLPSVIGAVTWKRNACEDYLSNYSTMTDEAFVVFTIENNYDTWVAMAKKAKGKLDGKDVSGIVEVKPPYTDGFGNNARKYSGWNTAGKSLWNKIARQVQKLRKESNLAATAGKPNYEQDFLKKTRQELQSDGEIDITGQNEDADEMEEEPLISDL